MCETAIKVIQDRIKQHKDNLVGWAEGEPCWCADTFSEVLIKARTMLSPPIWARQDNYNPNCHSCFGTGMRDRGYLVPTEPDPEDRQAVRDRLTVGITELESILREIQ